MNDFPDSLSISSNVSGIKRPPDTNVSPSSAQSSKRKSRSGARKKVDKTYTSPISIFTNNANVVSCCPDVRYDQQQRQQVKNISAISSNCVSQSNIVSPTSQYVAVSGSNIRQPTNVAAASDLRSLPIRATSSNFISQSTIVSPTSQNVDLSASNTRKPLAALDSNVQSLSKLRHTVNNGNGQPTNVAKASDLSSLSRRDNTRVLSQLPPYPERNKNLNAILSARMKTRNNETTVQANKENVSLQFTNSSANQTPPPDRGMSQVNLGNIAAHTRTTPASTSHCNNYRVNTNNAEHMINLKKDGCFTGNSGHLPSLSEKIDLTVPDPKDLGIKLPEWFTGPTTTQNDDDEFPQASSSKNLLRSFNYAADISMSTSDCTPVTLNENEVEPDHSEFDDDDLYGLLYLKT